MAFTSYSDLLNKQTDATKTQSLFAFKLNRSAGVAQGALGNAYRSAWKNDGTGGSGATPTTAATYDNTSAGCLPYALATGVNSLYLTGFMSSMASVNGAVVLYDRMAAIGGLVANVTTEQMTTGLAPARNTGGVGNKIFIEVYTSVGGTSSTLTVNYTNQAGTAGRISGATRIGGTAFGVASALIEVPLMDGDTGVQSVESVTLSATTGTAGNFGVTIMREIFNAAAGVPVITQAGFKGLATIPAGACLMLAYYNGSNITPDTFLNLQLTEA
ncbi:MAG: hypothetical protein IPL34_20415 [Thiofilum sp.]|uniref:hypothetical protein n=1 Tax=Thiofilum sp. TaxID=2212733 RepID=UPI0025F06E45|nr:hypothetical protein [Thiofilum sp.]MBK8455647.1 hypothetical protein [Thiofilum sp.]